MINSYNTIKFNDINICALPKTIKKEIKRGQVWWANLGDYIGSVQGGLRPVVIVQNNIGNKFSPTTIVIPLTSKLVKNNLPTHALLNSEHFLESLSLALGEQTRVIDIQKQLLEYLGDVSEDTMKNINIAIETAVGLKKIFNFEKAYEMLCQIDNVDNMISKLKKVKEGFTQRNIIIGLEGNKIFLENQFNNYCKEYTMNSDIVKLKYNNDYLNQFKAIQ